MLFGEFAKSQAEAEYPELWQGLVGAWSPCLSPPGGTVLRDLSGRGNHGTLTNMDPATDWVVSGGRQALDFDGSNDYVLTNAATTRFGAAPFFLSLWCAFVGDGAESFILDSSRSVAVGGVLVDFRDDLASDGLDIYVVNSAANYDLVRYSSSIKGSQLTHIAYWRDGVNHHLWINGKQAIAPGTDNLRDVSTGSDAMTFAAKSNAPAFYGAFSLYDAIIGSGSLGANNAHLLFRLGPGGWATPRRRRWNYATAQTAIPYWVFARKNARLIGGGVS